MGDGRWLCFVLLNVDLHVVMLVPVFVSFSMCIFHVVVLMCVLFYRTAFRASLLLMIAWEEGGGDVSKFFVSFSWLTIDCFLPLGKKESVEN